MSDSADYYYLHERPVLRYRVEVAPPATTTRLEVHRRSPSGEVVHRDEALAREGEGEVVLDLAALGLTVADSPLFAEFTFTREDGPRPVVKKSVQVLALAEPVVSSIYAPSEGYPGEALKVEVLDWDVCAYDEPDKATRFFERDPDRVSADARASVRWRLAGKELAGRGEALSAPLAADHLGRMVVVEAYLGAGPPPGALRVVVPRVSTRLQRSRLQRSPAEPARCEVAVPSLAIAGPTTVRVGESITLEAALDPPVLGAFEWAFEGAGRVETTELGGVASVQGVAPGEVLARCTFRSEALRTYRREATLTVTGR